MPARPWCACREKAGFLKKLDNASLGGLVTVPEPGPGSPARGSQSSASTWEQRQELCFPARPQERRLQGVFLRRGLQCSQKAETVQLAFIIRKRIIRDYIWASLSTVFQSVSANRSSPWSSTALRPNLTQHLEGAGETLQYEGAGPVRDRWEARFLKQPGCPEFGAGTLAVPMGECSSVVYDVQARTHFWSGTWVTDATVAVLLASLITGIRSDAEMRGCFAPKTLRETSSDGEALSS
ncbi:uncharacterized protein RBU33_010650 [Hipposideros larvatus]